MLLFELIIVDENVIKILITDREKTFIYRWTPSDWKVAATNEKRSTIQGRPNKDQEQDSFKGSKHKMGNLIQSCRIKTLKTIVLKMDAQGAHPRLMPKMIKPKTSPKLIAQDNNAQD